MVPWWCMPVILLLVFLQSLTPQEVWGPGETNSSPHPWCYPRGWSPHKRGSWAPLHHTVFAERFYCPGLPQQTWDTPSTPLWDSQVFCTQKWINLPDAVCTMLSACIITYSVRHMEAQRNPMHLKVPKQCPMLDPPNFISPCILPPLAHIQHSSQKLSSGNDRVFPWHFL